MDVPLHKYWGVMSPCPIVIDSPDIISYLSVLYSDGELTSCAL